MLPLFIVRLVLFKLILLAGIFTLIIHVAFLLFEVFTVIVTLPGFIPFTTPFLSTFAILLSDELHVIVLLLAFVGNTVAFNCKFVFTAIVLSICFNVTELTATGFVLGIFTVILQVAVFPFVVFAVIIVIPSLFASTFPIPSTVATFVFDELHVTTLLFAFVGLIVAINFVTFPFSIVKFVWFNLIPVTSTVHLSSIYFFHSGCFCLIVGIVVAAIYSNSLNVSLESIIPS